MRGYYALRYQVLERDKFICQYCGQSAPSVKLEVDHLVSVEDGGQDNLDNLITSCFACNRGRSSLRIQATRKGYRWIAPMLKVSRHQQATLRERAIIILRTHPEGTKAKMIAQELSITESHAWVLLSRLVKQNQAQRISHLQGTYQAIP